MTNTHVDTALLDQQVLSFNSMDLRSTAGYANQEQFLVTPKNPLQPQLLSQAEQTANALQLLENTLGNQGGLGSTMKGGSTTQHKIENLLELIRSNQSKII